MPPLQSRLYSPLPWAWEDLEPELYPPSQKTTGLPVDECANNEYATARCRPEAEADNRVVAEGEDGYFSGTTGLPVGLHRTHLKHNDEPMIYMVSVHNHNFSDVCQHSNGYCVNRNCLDRS